MNPPAPVTQTVWPAPVCLPAVMIILSMDTNIDNSQTQFVLFGFRMNAIAGLHSSDTDIHRDLYKGERKQQFRLITVFQLSMDHWVLCDQMKQSLIRDSR
jgi:hypothetical protein